MAGRKSTSKAIRRQREERKFTIPDAFSPGLQTPGDAPGNNPEKVRDVERDLRAIELLIFHATEEGNEDLDALAASGIAALLRGCADKCARLHIHVREEHDALQEAMRQGFGIEMERKPASRPVAVPNICAGKNPAAERLESYICEPPLGAEDGQASEGVTA